MRNGYNKRWRKKQEESFMHEIKKGENKFYIGEDIKEPIAELTFIESGKNRIVADHTYVSNELRGQGIAGQLVEHLVQYAREKGKVILPECPYVERKLKENLDYHDVLAK
ncbi:GNAT family N-acetyltransferase [Compostibacillus humi]|nr:GNAT family N-acetyltransferase [Compostibacillus humi]